MRPDPKRERDLLDSLEDARFELDARKKRIYAWGVLGLTLTAIVGVSIPLGILLSDLWFIGTLVGGVLMLIYIVITCLGYADDDLTTSNVRKSVRQAERAHRNYLMSLEDS